MADNLATTEALTAAVRTLSSARDVDESDAIRWLIGAAETATEAAVRERDLAPHRVAHNIVTTTSEVETFEGGHADNIREPLDGKPGRRRTVERHNKRDDCPDCRRGLVSANDADLPTGITHLLVCSRLYGLKVSGKGLTDDDIVACGREG